MKNRQRKVKIYQNISDAAKAALRRTVIVINAYIKQQEKPQVSNLILYLKAPGEEMTTKVSRRKVVTKLKAKIKRKI